MTTSPIWDRKTTPAVAVSLIRRCEGVRLAAYKDSVGRWTIGAGSTHMLSGRAVQAGDKISSTQADELLAEQCDTWVADVARYISWSLTETQAAALISFTHNLGAGALEGTMIAKMANAGDMALAGNQMNGWAVAGGQVAVGLLRRREYERRIFAGEVEEGQAAYNTVWSMGEPALMPLYDRAFAEAKTWGWSPSQAAQTVHAGTPAGKPPVTRPVPQVSPAQSTETADDLMAQEQAGTLDVADGAS